MPPPQSSRPLPITILTGYVGSGKTTLLLNLLPQLLAQPAPHPRLALIKNEIGDLNIDSQLASQSTNGGILPSSGTVELLGACICCTNVGQMGEAIAALERNVDPDRVVIETSGSAEPIKLVLELKRLADERRRIATSSTEVEQQSQRPLEIDGVISVIDVLNWSGYANTSFTAKLQAKQTDLIVLNKWEDAGEAALETCLDRLGDMDVDTPHIKSDRGWISKDLFFGIDRADDAVWETGHDHGHGDGHAHQHHMEEMECLDVTLRSKTSQAEIDLQKLDTLLATAPKDEIFRIKAILHCSVRSPTGVSNPHEHGGRYVLNWAFGRHTWTAIDPPTVETSQIGGEPLLRMSIFTARFEASKWQKRIESGQFIALASDPTKAELTVKKVS